MALSAVFSCRHTVGKMERTQGARVPLILVFQLPLTLPCTTKPWPNVVAAKRDQSLRQRNLR